MNEILIVILMGAGIAVVVEGLKLAGIPLAGKQKIVRLFVVAAALVLAYIALQGSADLAVQQVLAYAAGVVVSAEGVYQWVVKQVKSKGE